MRKIIAAFIFKEFMMRILLYSISLLLFFVTAVAAQNHIEKSELLFDDHPVARSYAVPSWFKRSFLNLRDDLADVRAANKLGLIVYFGQANCPYCKHLLEINWEKHRDIVAYTRKHFEVTAIDIWGALEVTLPDGSVLNEKTYADREQTNFTPSLVFYDTQGQQIFRLRGYYPPYQFRAALDYVINGYYREETFRHYLDRATAAFAYGEEDTLNHNELFMSPPYILARNKIPAQTPLVVFFEQPACHACDILHGHVLYQQNLYQNLAKMEVVQLDMWAETPVITPDGTHTTARAWADALGLFFTPSLLFFDAHGKEIFRVDSVVQEHRLDKVLKYILSKAYLQNPHFQRWYQQELGS
jgi:thioredoxin-related protein